MTFKIDLHVHSRYSGDNDADPEETVLRAIELKLHGIAFTEHSSYEASEPVERLKEKYRGAIMIFRGVEFSTAEGHCLVFGVDTDTLALKYAPAREVTAAVVQSGGVVIPSHPYRPGSSLGDLTRDLQGITAIEGHNGANLYSFNARAVELAGSLRLPYTGGSDAHAPKEVGSCVTEFRESATYENFVDLLKAGNYRGVDRRKIFRL